MIFIVISLLPAISNQIDMVLSTGEITGLNATIAELVPGFFAIIGIVTGIIVAYIGLKSAGFLSFEEEAEEFDSYSIKSNYHEEEKEKVNQTEYKSKLNTKTNEKEFVKSEFD